MDKTYTYNKKVSDDKDSPGRTVRLKIALNTALWKKKEKNKLNKIPPLAPIPNAPSFS